MYTQKKINSGLLAILFLTATVLLLAFHTRPAQKQTNALADKISALESEVKALGARSEELAPAGTLSEVEQKELDKAIPANLEQDIIISNLNTLSKSADVSFNALTFGLQKQGNLPTVNISAGFQGTSGSILRFMKMLEVNPRKFLIKDAGVSHLQSEGGLDLVNLNLTLQAFYRNEQ
ncbi:MAG: hypothetical protein AAB606_04335 [Patescibacteria group bacterium]|mgnify:CR=1 FL=1